jgi:ubiquinone/menaquinone biosynthesis C-methylase UbiE
MHYDEQKKFFETAYRTGSDIWTDKHYHSKVFEYLAKIPQGSMVLDLGTGRGRWPFAMVDLGLRVIGVDYIKHLIKVNNQEAKAKHLQGKIRFVEGDVFDIGFADATFDAVTDFGLLQHMRHEDWPKYGGEVSRVLRPGGHVISVAYSRETPKLFDFVPGDSDDGDFEKYGVHYHFFSESEILDAYGYNFQIIKQETVHLEKHNETLLFSLLQKN